MHPLAPASGSVRQRSSLTFCAEHSKATMAEKEWKAGSTASWSGWNVFGTEAEKDEQQPPIYTERNIPDAPITYAGPATPTVGPSNSKKDFDVATLDKGFHAAWPPWGQAQQETVERDAEGRARYEYMLWTLSGTGIRFEDMDGEANANIMNAPAKHKPPDHPAVVAREEALRLAKDKPAGPTCGASWGVRG